MLGWIVKDTAAEDRPAYHEESLSLDNAEEAWEAFREKNPVVEVADHECVTVRIARVSDLADF